MTQDETRIEAAAEAEPFGPADAAQTPEELAETRAVAIIRASVGQLLAARDVLDVQQTPPLVDKVQLAAVPHLIHQVTAQPVADVETGEVRYELVICAAQPVQLAPDRTVKRAGRIVLYIAGRINQLGRVDSVLGRECYELALAEPPAWPYLAPHGLREVTSGGGGTYWTLRPDSATTQVDIWGDE